MSEERQQTLTYRLYEAASSLPQEEQELLKAAEEALRHSYSPYSDFPVGAAILLTDGSVIQASNQENAAFPSGMCAERIAIWKAATERPEEGMKSIALTTERSKGATPVSPCGACRQVMKEIEDGGGSELRVLFPGGNGRMIAVDRVGDLLPFPFGIASLRDDEGER